LKLSRIRSPSEGDLEGIGGTLLLFDGHAHGPEECGLADVVPTGDERNSWVEQQDLLFAVALEPTYAEAQKSQ
jgi:hypothetical protein